MAAEFDTREEWKSIAGAEGYLVSSLGRVRGKRGGMLRPFINRDGYEMHTFYVSGRHFKRAAHVLVCEAFHGPKPEASLHCAHIDTDKLNNAATNLKWATAKENAADGLRCGKYSYGGDHWTHKNPEKLARGDAHHSRKYPERVQRGAAKVNATLTDEQAREVRMEPTRKGVVPFLASRFDVSPHVINDIRRNRSYRHV